MDDTTEEKQERTASEAVLKVLESADAPLKKDSIAAIIVLESEIAVSESLVRLLKTGKIEAKFKGDKSKTMHLEDFRFERVNESGEEQGEK